MHSPSLSTEHLAALHPHIRSELGRRRLLDFAEVVYPGFERARHINLLADHLEQLERRTTRRLVVELPPRHGKTVLTSQIFPAWFIGRNPKAQIVLASYGSELAESNSRRVRDIVGAHAYPFKEFQLREDSRAVNRWQTSSGSALVAVGVGSGLTGHGADLLIIDDAVRDREAAESEAIRESTWLWYQDVARTRLHPGARQILIGTRWHEDDLIGRILSSAGAEEWQVLKLPAICDDPDNDLLGRKLGEALWPERFPPEELPSVEKGEISSRGFAALYQQRPAPAEGAIFKAAWFEKRFEDQSEIVDVPPMVPARTNPMFASYLVKPPPPIVVMAVDCAAKTGVSNDFSAIATAASNRINYYLLDVVRERLEFADLCRAIVAAYRKHMPRLVYIEGASSGFAVIQELKRVTHLPIVEIAAKSSKIAKAEAISPLFESGRVYLPESAPWLKSYLDEMTSFPVGRHDDMVDATCLALLQLQEIVRHANVPPLQIPENWMAR